MSSVLNADSVSTKQLCFAYQIRKIEVPINQQLCSINRRSNKRISTEHAILGVLSLTVRWKPEEETMMWCYSRAEHHHYHTRRLTGPRLGYSD